MPQQERFLRQSIDSILMQSYREFEFIIWNDGSTDSTEEIIKSYHDERIRYFYAPNQGLVSALALHQDTINRLAQKSL